MNKGRIFAATLSQKLREGPTQRDSTAGDGLSSRRPFQTIWWFRFVDHRGPAEL